MTKTKTTEVTVWAVWDPESWPDHEAGPQLRSYTFRRQPSRWYLCDYVMEFGFHRHYPLDGDSAPAGCSWTPAEAIQRYIEWGRKSADSSRREAVKFDHWADLAEQLPEPTP